MDSNDGGMVILSLIMTMIIISKYIMRKWVLFDRLEDFVRILEFVK